MAKPTYDELVQRVQQLEQQLTASCQENTSTFFQELFENMSNGVAVYRPINDGDDFLFVDLNPAGERFSFVQKENVIGKSIAEVFPGVKKMGLWDVLFRVHKTGEPELLPTKLYTDDRIEEWAENYVFRLPSGLVVAVYKDVTAEHQAEVALRESEERYKSLFKESFSVMLLINPETGAIEDANQAACDYYGYTHHELAQMNINQINILSQQEIHKAMQDAKQQKRNHFQFVHRLADGSLRDIETYSGKIIFSGRSLLYSIIHDITERKQVEKKLRESELKFRNMYENTSVGVALVDLHFKITAANKAYCDMLGYRESELVGKSLQDITQPEILEKNLQLQRKLKCGEIQSYQMEKQFIHKDGHVVYGLLNATLIHDENGKSLYFLGNVQDITQRKEAEQAAHLWTKVFENAGWGIVVGDPQGEVLGQMNQAFAQMHGYTIDELVGQPITSVFAPICHHDIQTHIQKAHEQKHYVFESYHIHKNGHIFPVLHNVTSLYDAWGKIQYRIVNAQDISQLKQVERELIKAKEKAEESDRLKSAFLANMSHEIRTPMNGIIGFSEMLKEKDLTEQQRHYYAQIIMNSAHQLLHIVNDILDISRIESGNATLKREKVVVNDIILELFAFFNPKTQEHNLSLFPFLKLDNAASTIITDETKLRQILNNLLSNAFKFTQSGYIRFGYEKIDNELRFFVKDTGIGIAPEMQEFIFDRFRQVETEIARQQSGTGLGLAICKKFVELLGGRIWLKSLPNKGSTFYFTLPYKTTLSSISLQNEEPITESTILIVEDEEINFLYLEEILRVLHLSILHAQDGRDAVEICRKNPHIALVLMDIKLPLLDGYQATREIKQIRPQLPVIAQTAYAMDEDRQKAMKAGCDAYLAKPIERKELLEMVKKYVEKD